MKTIALLVVAVLPVSTLDAAPRTSANYSITADTADLGGLRAASVNYAHDGSASAVAGLSFVTAPAETVKHGYLGQLFDVTGLVVNAAAPTVAETATLQLGAWQLLDDASFLSVSAAAVAWSVVSGPLDGISAAGVATAGIVHQDTAATAQGMFGGFPGTVALTVFDTLPDNFGAYAGDGLADAWQVQHFGLDNPLAAPGLDPDGDGQTNVLEFTAGLVPTDAASFFRLLIAPVVGQPTHKNLIFSPRFPDRTYTVGYRLNLLGGAWEPLGGTTFLDDGDARTVTDPNATDAARFYRVEITKP